MAINTKKDSLSTYGVENMNTIKVNSKNTNIKKMTKEELKNKVPHDTPTFYSVQRG